MFGPKRDKKEKVKLTKSSWKQAKRILSYFAPYKVKFGIGILILISSSALSMLFPSLTGKLLDAINGKSVNVIGYEFQGIDSIAFALFILFGLQAIMSFFRIYLFNEVTERVIMNIRQDSYKHLISLPMTFFSSKRVGELNSRLSADIAQIQETFTIVLAELARQAVTLLIGIPALTYYSPRLAITMLAVLPVVIFFAVIMGKWVKKFSKQTQTAVSDANVITEETFTAIQSVKAFANEFLEISRYSKKTNDARLIAMKGVYARGAMASIIVFGIFGSITLVIWQAAKLIETGDLTIGDLTTFLLFTIFVGASLAGSADLLARFQKGVGATENLFNLLDETPETINTTDSSNDHENVIGDIEFEKVSFNYPSRKDVTVLNNINFSARQGQTIALVGSSGAGKSTITSLLFRFYDTTRGAIKIGGKSIQSMSLSSLRNQMAIVPQEVILFGGTIKENIAYGKPGASEEEIIEAARKANALEFITNFPDKFETLVGERGIQLSGGQRQRIAIARAILKNPSILILDEATSSLDSESEKLVQEALDYLMRGRTSIVIAHRLSTIRKADQILVLQHGQIVERGNHEELMQINKGFYKNLSDLQLEVH